MNQLTFNQKDIVSVELIKNEDAAFYANGLKVEAKEIFNVKDFYMKKLLKVEVTDSGNRTDAKTDIAIKKDTGTKLIFDIEDISFSSQGEQNLAGTLYNNKLTYSIPKLDEEEAELAEQQIEMISNGKGYHLLFYFRECGHASRGIVLCPTDNAFKAEITDNVTNVEVEIKILNLSSHQWCK